MVEGKGRESLKKDLDSDGRRVEGKAGENFNKSYISEIARWKAMEGKFK